MPFSERVTSYTVAHISNDIVDYHAVVHLTTETGHRVFIGFPPRRPSNWLIVTGTDTTVFMTRSEFDSIHHTLQSESPLFVTAFNFIGIRAFNLSTTEELPGEGPADDEALVRFMTQVRELDAMSG